MQIMNFCRERQENTEFLLSIARKKIIYSLKNVVNIIYGKKSRNNKEILVLIQNMCEFIINDKNLLRLFVKRFKKLD